MADRGFDNDKYGYLPRELRNPFVEDGHNTYGKATPSAPKGGGPLRKSPPKVADGPGSGFGPVRSGSGKPWTPSTGSKPSLEGGGGFKVPSKKGKKLPKGKRVM